MQYSRLVTVPTDNADYCFCGRIKDAGACELRIQEGERVGTDYPRDPFSVNVHLDPDFPGVKLPSLLGNTRSLLVLSRDAVRLLEAHLDLGEHEAFPFTLVNHKGRVHSKDYVFLNPLGSFDVADPQSDFLRFPSGGIYGCKRWVLASSKLDKLPDILRPRAFPRHYFVSERFVAVVAEHGLTNFEFQPVDHV